MKRSKISIINYGVGNLLNVSNAFNHLGYEVFVTDNEKKILSSSHIVLPGVGSFESGMNGINNNGLKDIIYKAVKNQIPFLGICLGMQLLMDESDEFGKHQGLGLIPGKVEFIKKNKNYKKNIKLPIIGWNKIFINENNFLFNKEEMLTNKMYYFVHSYMAIPENNKHVNYFMNYHNIKIPAIISNKNICGFQFHPEKSGKLGINLLDFFIKNFNNIR